MADLLDRKPAENAWGWPELTAERKSNKKITDLNIHQVPIQWAMYILTMILATMTCIEC